MSKNTEQGHEVQNKSTAGFNLSIPPFFWEVWEMQMKMFRMILAKYK